MLMVCFWLISQVTHIQTVELVVASEGIGWTLEFR